MSLRVKRRMLDLVGIRCELMRGVESGYFCCGIDVLIARSVCMIRNPYKSDGVL